MELTIEEKKFLLKVARKAIQSIFTSEEIPKADYEKYPNLKNKAGAFVTLTEYGQLRGCIGFIVSDKPLYETVIDAAISSAQNDPRFPPVRKSELENIEIEISVLSEPFPLNSYDDIIVGKHGLILEEKGRRGLLLPQVPIEHNMNKEQFLDAICQKAGFPAGYWRTKQLKLSGFTAIVFNEKELEEK
ncbi:MAG: AmmeMemoRadiSam system protein A [Melioribacter sp.]|nr:AmmeMemoRadiSam system protein A [Melioribacter sp.]